MLIPAKTRTKASAARGRSGDCDRYVCGGLRGNRPPRLVQELRRRSWDIPRTGRACLTGSVRAIQIADLPSLLPIRPVLQHQFLSLCLTLGRPGQLARSGGRLSPCSGDASPAELVAGHRAQSGCATESRLAGTQRGGRHSVAPQGIPKRGEEAVRSASSGEASAAPHSPRKLNRASL